MKRRKLGAKNNILFSIISFLFIGIIVIFVYFINYQLKKKDNTYQLTTGIGLFDYKNNYIETGENAVITKHFDGNYYLTHVKEDVEYREKLGKTSVTYKDGDYKINFYGIAYKISPSGEVEKITGETEIVKSGSPYFYKISDRKYMFVDKRLQTNDGSIKTTDYLIIELDKQGNATFTNFENNVRTIKPLILKGSRYDFDIANEKLIINADFEIDLKTVVGSSNEYVPEEPDLEEEVKEELSYYDKYFSALKDSFNNLSGSLGGMNENLQGEINKEDAYLDLTRWTVLKNVTAGVNSIKINYSVFDPNNEFSEIFIIVKKDGEETRIQLSKTNDTYTLSNLKADSEYEVSYGYKVIKAVGDDTTQTITDTVKVKTKELNYNISITKITSSRIYYTVTFNNDYIPSSCQITLYSGELVAGSRMISGNEISKNKFSGYFETNNLDYVVTLKLDSVSYNGNSVNYEVYTKYVN